MANIRSYRELDVYKTAFDGAMRLFQLTKHFPVEERYSMVGPGASVRAVRLCEYRRSVA